jgi:hypothetical protein
VTRLYRRDDVPEVSRSFTRDWPKALQGTMYRPPRILADSASSPCTSLGFRRFAAPPRDYEPQRNPRSHPAMRPHLLGSRGGFRRSGGYHLFAPRPAHPRSVRSSIKVVP